MPGLRRFNYPAGTPQGDKERREADAERKRAARAVAAKMVEPPPLPTSPAGVVDSLSTPAAGQMPGTVAAPVEMVVPWTLEDVKDFTDELVDLSEAKRVADFVVLAREAKLPPKLIAEIEKDARYPITSKAGLKRALAATVAKWLNKSGISAKNKEEAALIFCMITIRLQGARMRARLNQMIEDDARRQEQAKAAPATGKPAIQ